MATTEEKNNLVDTLKGPRYYRITLHGYGGESAYINIDKAAFDFWNPNVELSGDSDLVNYMITDDEEYEFEDIDNVPTEADFLKDSDYKYPWYEGPGEFCHQMGVEFGSAYITVDEVDSAEYNSKIIRNVMDGVEVSDLCNRIADETDYEYEPADHGEAEFMVEEGDYVVQFYSSEKGTFFDGIIETVGEFDPKELKFIINEYPNGEDIIDSVMYANQDVDNSGAETSGKGYSAHLWSNV